MPVSFYCCYSCTARPIGESLPIAATLQKIAHCQTLHKYSNMPLHLAKCKELTEPVEKIKQTPNHNGTNKDGHCGAWLKLQYECLIKAHKD